jgi:pimeloyl-ACP methyl ester carboxylesterase
VVILVGICVDATASPARPSDTSENCARNVDIGGGRTMFPECRGTGAPTVIFEAGYRNRGDVWSAQPDPPHRIRTVEPEVARFTRVCTYDRSGTTFGTDQRSRSDPVPNPRTAQEAVQDLHTLLQAAKVPGPYVLVGHSLGGLFVRLYASEYPDQVDGMVLVDALPEQLQGQLTADDYARYAGLVAAIPNELASYADLETIDLAVSFEQMRQAASAHPTPGDATRRHRPR